MAKRGRRPKGTLASLAAELERVSARRQELIEEIRQATETLASGENPFPWAGNRTASGAAGARRGRRRGGRRKGFKMSAAAKAKISAAAKKRWAEKKKKEG